MIVDDVAERATWDQSFVEREETFRRKSPTNRNASSSARNINDECGMTIHGERDWRANEPFVQFVQGSKANGGGGGGFGQHDVRCCFQRPVNESSVGCGEDVDRNGRGSLLGEFSDSARPFVERTTPSARVNITTCLQPNSKSDLNLRTAESTLLGMSTTGQHVSHSTSSTSGFVASNSVMSPERIESSSDRTLSFSPSVTILSQSLENTDQHTTSAHHADAITTSVEPALIHGLSDLNSSATESVFQVRSSSSDVESSVRRQHLYNNIPLATASTPTAAAATAAASSFTATPSQSAFSSQLDEMGSLLAAQQQMSINDKVFSRKELEENLMKIRAAVDKVIQRNESVLAAASAGKPGSRQNSSSNSGGSSRSGSSSDSSGGHVTSPSPPPASLHPASTPPLAGAGVMCQDKLHARLSHGGLKPQVNTNEVDLSLTSRKISKATSSASVITSSTRSLASLTGMIELGAAHQHLPSPNSTTLGSDQMGKCGERLDLMITRHPAHGSHHPTHLPTHATTDEDGTATAYSRAVRFLAEWDLETLELAYSRLATCGFYLGRMSIDEASRLLRSFEVGTFLVRDSSDSRFLFALSVQTVRGTTSIRIAYQTGLFRLDSDDDQVHIMPTFRCVLGLVRYYMSLSYGRGRAGPEQPRNAYVFLESSGRKDTPVVLRKPIEVLPPRLTHVCRKRINGLLAGNSVDRLVLSPSLKKYLLDYPYDF